MTGKNKTKKTRRRTQAAPTRPISPPPPGRPRPKAKPGSRRRLAVAAIFQATPGIGWRARELAEILGDTDNMNSLSTQISSWAARGLISKIAPATYMLN